MAIYKNFDKKYQVIKVSKGQTSMPQWSEKVFYFIIFFYVGIISSTPNLTKVENDGMKKQSFNTITRSLYSQIKI